MMHISPGRFGRLVFGLIFFLASFVSAEMPSHRILSPVQIEKVISFCKTHGTRAYLESIVTVYGLTGESWAKTKEEGLKPCKVYFNIYCVNGTNAIEVCSETDFGDGYLHLQIVRDLDGDTIPDEGRVVILKSVDGNWLKEGDSRWIKVEFNDGYYGTFSRVLLNIYTIAVTEK